MASSYCFRAQLKKRCVDNCRTALPCASWASTDGSNLSTRNACCRSSRWGPRAPFAAGPAAGGGHSLPAERDAFVGRREVLGLQRRFDDGARLVSVLGVGGTGKTRVATRYGRTGSASFPAASGSAIWRLRAVLDGIVERSCARSRHSARQRRSGDADRHAIAGRGPCLVILDNFEQVARAAQTLGHWLDRADQARFVVTTREVLGLAGEVVLALPPLLPADGAALFVQRAEAAKPDFRPNAEEQAAIAPLVELLDGLPLAIELAAARVRVMPPRVLLSRMSERFKLLASKVAGSTANRRCTPRSTGHGICCLRPKSSVGATVGIRRRLHARGGRGGDRPVCLRRRTVDRGCGAGASRQVLRAIAQRRPIRPARQCAGLRGRTLADRGTLSRQWPAPALRPSRGIRMVCVARADTRDRGALCGPRQPRDGVQACSGTRQRRRGCGRTGGRVGGA